jgi:hypothetical protein
MAKFLSTVVFSTSSLAALRTDPQAGEKLFNAIQATMTGGDTLVKVGDLLVAQAVESHLEDQTRIIAVSGKGGRDMGEAGKASNMDPCNERPLLEALAANYDLVIRKEAVRGEKTAESAEAGVSTDSAAPAAS